MIMLVGTLLSRADKDIEKHQSIVYVQNAPEDFKYILENIKEPSKVEYINQNQDISDLKDGILKGTVDLLIVFEVNFTDSIKNYSTTSSIPQVKTYYNPSEDYSSSARTHFATELLETYRKQLLTERIKDLSSITIFTVDTDNSQMIIQDNDKATGKMLGMMLPYIITLMLFAGAMSLGTDTITGEKERGTLASLLITPLKRSSIVLGKLLALMTLSGLSATSYIVSMVIALPIMVKSLGGKDALTDLAIHFTIGQILELVCLLISLAFLYVAIVALVAVFAKTAKEGATYVSPVFMLVMAVGMMTMYGSGKSQLFQYFIPLYNSSIALKDLFARELSLMEFMITFATTLCTGGILTAIIVKAFNSEKVMFNA
jgi:sodium transport system permease protein